MEETADDDQLIALDAVDDDVPPVMKAADGIVIVNLAPEAGIISDELEDIFEGIAVALGLANAEGRNPIEKGVDQILFGFVGQSITHDPGADRSV